jgi:hypothetical protein
VIAVYRHGVLLGLGGHADLLEELAVGEHRGDLRRLGGEILLGGELHAVHCGGRDAVIVADGRQWRRPAEVC